MGWGLRTHGDENPKEREAALLVARSPILGCGDRCLSCDLFGGPSSLTHPGPNPQTWAWEAAGGSGSVPLKPEAPCPAPLTHPGLSPAGGRPAAATVASAADTDRH